MAVMMRQNSVPFDSEADYNGWNPRSLSTFQTFHGGTNGGIGNGIHHAHSKSLIAEDTPVHLKPTRLASRSFGEAQDFLSLNNGTLLVKERNIMPRVNPTNHVTQRFVVTTLTTLPSVDGSLEVRIGLGPSDKRFGFSVVGGTEEGFHPNIDKITEGSPADRADLEVGDEILEVNGKSLENATHTEVISHIHQCIRSRTICLRVKRKSGSKIAADLANNSNVQDAFVIAVEQQARDRLEKLSTLKQIEPVDMAKLSQQLSSEDSAPNLNSSTRGSQKSIKKPTVNGKENVSVISIGAETQTTISIGPTDELDGEVFQNGKQAVVPVTNNSESLKSMSVSLDPSSAKSVTVISGDSGFSSGTSHRRQKSETGVAVNPDSGQKSDEIFRKPPLVHEPEKKPSGVVRRLALSADAEHESEEIPRNIPNPESSWRKVEETSVIPEIGQKPEQLLPRPDSGRKVGEVNVKSDIGRKPELATSGPNSGRETEELRPKPESVGQKSSKRWSDPSSKAGIDKVSLKSEQSETAPEESEISKKSEELLPVKVDDLDLTFGNPPELLSPIGSPSVWINEMKSKVEATLNESPKNGRRNSAKKERKEEAPKQKPSRKKQESASDLPAIKLPPERTSVIQPPIPSPALEISVHKRPPGLEDVVLGVPGGKKGRGSGTLPKSLKENQYNGEGDGSRGASLRSSGTSSAHSSELDDSSSHREMAVDVPDNFISRTKTPPKWPTQKNSTLNGYKPSLPSREHLKIEEDGRLINRAQPPQVPTKAIQSVPPPQSIEMMEQPSKEQLDRIRKYQEDTKKRRELEEKLAQEEEFLRSSLRGSRKLQALENDPPKSQHGSTGFVNTAFDVEDEGRFTQPPSPVEGQIGKNLVPGVKDLQTALMHVQQHLKRNGYAVETDLATVHSLFTSPAFRSALSVHSRVQESFCVQRPPSPLVESALDLVSECITSLQDSSQTEAAQLVDILSRFEIEGLIYAHDRIAERMVLPPLSENDVSVDADSSTTSSVKGHLPVTPQPSHSPILLDDGIRIVRIEKTNEPLGATVRNDGESVVIGRIVRGGAAERCGQLHENDEVLEVNGVPLRGKSVNDVCDLLAGMTGTLTFVIQPANDTKPSSPTTHGVMHVKAHFDYDPEDDLYIPCRELGLSFQKGDVLHVISQEDGNWWQAHRDGEEEHNLAGLIPSKSFQQQREIMKQTIMADSVESKRSKKNTLLCARKMHKKKKKKVQYNSNFTDDFDSEEILTYEEVALYYPRAYHKRPMVLIGPPNIGRQELRQRLMLDSERFAAAVPHTSRPKKDYELDGQDYHFISRAQFEGDIVQRRFVEHGEYERSYYGTSVDAIRAVINQGKICVLNLHPQSLKLLRTSDLMPHVVFVAPPSLEKLRQKKIAKGEPVKDDELKDIIEKAREMEESYGHYFDLVIVNSDDERTYAQLLQEVNILEREPQWVPAAWLRGERPHS